MTFKIKQRKIKLDKTSSANIIKQSEDNYHGFKLERAMRYPT